MKAKVTATLAGIFALHLIYTLFFKNPGCGPRITYISYFTGGDVFLGVSLALGATFTMWSFRQFASTRAKQAAAGAAGGSALVVGVAAAGCFFTGCCGSPMLIVYASLLGINGLEIPKWSIALLTVMSTGAGWWWLTRKKPPGCGADCC